MNPCTLDSVIPRRRFLEMGATFIAGATILPAASATHHPRLPDDIGVNTACFAQQQRATDVARRIDPYDIPHLVGEELDLRILDVVSTMLNTRDPAALERFRARADRAGCVITNLKVNLPAVRYDSEDAAVRRAAIEEYKGWIDAAVMLGARWLRPFPAATPPRWETLVAGFSELADYAAPRGITLLIENYRWLESQPDAIPRLVGALSGRVAAQPDTFNWVNDATRREGLAKAFPQAASCDFKVRELGPNYEHSAYDLRAAFQIGRDAGFRGPWCIEHLNANKAALLGDLKWITGRLRAWSAESKQP